MSPKRARFCELYHLYRNATKAYAEAYRCSGHAAETGGSRLLKNAEVRAKIDALTQETSEATGITAERVLEELAIIGFASPDHYKVELLGGLTLAADAPETAKRAIAGLKVKQYMHPTKGLVSQTEYKMWDKVAALTQLGRHFKLFTDVSEVQPTSEFAELLRAARERVAKGKA